MSNSATDSIVDSYRNNTNFPNDIMSDMTTKGLLGKWVAFLVSKVRCSLYSYYIKTNNIDYGDTNFVTQRFTETKGEIEYILPVLEDLVNANIHGFEDICIAVYGIGSDEVFMIRRFFQLCVCMPIWKKDSMWTDCSGCCGQAFL